MKLASLIKNTTHQIQNIACKFRMQEHRNTVNHKLAYNLKKYALSQCICVLLAALHRVMLVSPHEGLSSWIRQCQSSSSTRQQHEANSDGSDRDGGSQRVLFDNIHSFAPQPPPSAPAHKTTCFVECNTAEVLAVSRFSAGWPAMRCIVSTSGSTWLSSIAVDGKPVDLMLHT